MSERLTFGTCIKARDASSEAHREAAERLKRTCDRLRQQPDWSGLIGPHFKTGVWCETLQRVADGYTVKLPGWHGEAFFLLDNKGTMEADNYSPYYDHRKIDAKTGERIDGSGTVHPEVVCGRKEVGADGRWGNISYLNRLAQEFSVQSCMDVAEASLGRVENYAYNQDGSVDLDIEVLSL